MRSFLAAPAADGRLDLVLSEVTLRLQAIVRGAQHVKILWPRATVARPRFAMMKLQEGDRRSAPKLVNRNRRVMPISSDCTRCRPTHFAQAKRIVARLEWGDPKHHAAPRRAALASGFAARRCHRVRERRHSRAKQTANAPEVASAVRAVVPQSARGEPGCGETRRDMCSESRLPREAHDARRGAVRCSRAPPIPNDFAWAKRLITAHGHGAVLRPMNDAAYWCTTSTV